MTKAAYSTKDQGRQADAKLRERPHYNVDNVRRGMAELSQRWNDRLTWESLNIAKEYARGRLCIVIQLDRHARGRW